MQRSTCLQVGSLEPVISESSSVMPFPSPNMFFVLRVPGFDCGVLVGLAFMSDLGVESPASAFSAMVEIFEINVK